MIHPGPGRELALGLRGREPLACFPAGVPFARDDNGGVVAGIRGRGETGAESETSPTRGLAYPRFPI